jgi:hypothetical protein
LVGNMFFFYILMYVCVISCARCRILACIVLVTVSHMLCSVVASNQNLVHRF